MKEIKRLLKKNGCESVTTPRKTEIVAKAIEQWRQDRIRANDPSWNITPELEELQEGGYLSSAQSMLMRDSYRSELEGKDYFEYEGFNEFQFDTKEAMQTTTFVSGSRGIGKSDLAMYVAQNLMKEGIIVLAFDPSQDWIRRSSIRQYQTLTWPYISEIPKESMIFDMSRLTPMQQQATVELFSKRLFEHQLNSNKRVYLIFEESQLFFPLNSLRSKRTQNSMRILTVGRNFGISVLAISQFPALIDKELIKNAQQIYVGCTSETNTIQYWRGILGKNTEKLKDLSNGEFLYYHRNKISKIQIEPYQVSLHKTEIKVPQVEPIKPITPTRQGSTMSVLFFVAFLLWSLWLLSMALSHMR